jgi:hypothetical protein
MLDIMVVREALKRSNGLESSSVVNNGNHTDDQDSLISLLIHDIFGGEILKTHMKNGWHFYNRIDGLRIDFTRLEIGKPCEENHFEDIPSTPDETYTYFEQVEYSTFLMRFVRAFEEAVGLEKYRPGLSA